MTWIDTEIVWGQTSKHWGCLCRRVSTSYMHCLMIFSITWHPGFSICVRDDWHDYFHYFQQTGSSDGHRALSNWIRQIRQKHQWNFREGQEGPRGPHQRHRLAYPIPCPQLVFFRFNSKNVRNLRYAMMQSKVQLEFQLQMLQKGKWDLSQHSI